MTSADAPVHVEYVVEMLDVGDEFDQRASRCCVTTVDKLFTLKYICYRALPADALHVTSHRRCVKPWSIH